MRNFIKGLGILSNFFDKGLDETYFMQAAHDQIFFFVDVEKLPEDSEEGRELIKLGFYVDENDGWSFNS